MSWQDATGAECVERGGAVDLVIEPRARDVGGFDVRRVLPSARRRRVGPFVFFDEMGPAEFAPGSGIDVRPHPHIGLATVTYLFEGQILHRDSLGSVQPITPGAVNWMTAGRGIVHSERTPADQLDHTRRLHGIQAWVALPTAQEETDPAFDHYPADVLPRIDRDGARMRLIAGTAYGQGAPVRTFTDMVYLDVDLDAGASLALPDEHAERAVYVVSGGVTIDGQDYAPGRMIVLAGGPGASVTATSASRLMILGGAPLDGDRLMWWNFVSSSPDRLEQAKADWKAGRFPPIEGETDFIPLPER